MDNKIIEVGMELARSINQSCELVAKVAKDIKSINAKMAKSIVSLHRSILSSPRDIAPKNFEMAELIVRP